MPATCMHHTYNRMTFMIFFHCLFTNASYYELYSGRGVAAGGKLRFLKSRF